MSKIIESKEFLPEKRNKKLLLLAAAGVAGIAVITVLYFVFGNGTKSSQNQFEENRQNQAERYEGPALKADNPLKPVDVTYEQLSDGALINKVSLLTATQQYAEAEKLITTQTNYMSSSTKLFLLANVQKAQNKNEDLAKTIDTIGKLSGLSASEFRSLGQLYSDIGQNQKAIEAYKKAISKFEQEKNGNYQQEVERLKQEIEKLEQ